MSWVFLDSEADEWVGAWRFKLAPGTLQMIVAKAGWAILGSAEEPQMPRGGVIDEADRCVRCVHGVMRDMAICYGI